MILNRKPLLVDILSLADYQKHSHFASLRAFISSPAVNYKLTGVLYLEGQFNGGLIFRNFTVSFSSNSKGQTIIMYFHV